MFAPDDDVPTNNGPADYQTSMEDPLVPGVVATKSRSPLKRTKKFLCGLIVNVITSLF